MSILLIKFTDKATQKLHCYTSGRSQKKRREKQKWVEMKVGSFRKKGAGGMRRKWEQKETKKETARENEDAAYWECQGKGQLPLQHFSLINYGNAWRLCK